MTERTRYAIVGTGGRHVMYRNSLTSLYANHAELVALCDRNPGRLALSQAKIREHAHMEIPGYADTDFRRMIDEAKPDSVIVTTMDSTHDEYICRAMEAGCDVVTEKPLTTSGDKLRRILDTQERTGRSVTVTFNYRYAPARGQVRQLLMDGVIGDVHSIDFHWVLDTRHGADYFRRWHRRRENSGGLLVHKATHHFDLVNWWLDSVPDSVFADGTRKFYTPEQGDSIGVTDRGDRCHDCPEASRCPFHLNLGANRGLRETYLEQEAHDGYYRDRCVFSDEIDIEDTMALKVRYRSGAIMNYSLIAYSPWEGYRVAFNGSKGRIEHEMIEGAHIIGDGREPGLAQRISTRIFPHFRPDYEIEVDWGEGGHGGADPVLLEHLFTDAGESDQLGRSADFRSGAWSVATGLCANESIRSGVPVRVTAFLGDMPLPRGLAS